MREKFSIPQADRLVGKGDVESFTDKTGKAISDPEEILKAWFIEHGSKIYDNELEKTQEDLVLIETAEKAVREYAAQYGREQFAEITPGHIHFLPDEGVHEFTKGRLGVGSHATVLGEVLVDRRDDLSTIITLFHELWHTLGSFQAIQITTEGTFDAYRSGFSAKTRDGEKEYFHHLDEALVGYMTQKFVYEKLQNDPKFKDEVETASRNNTPIDTTRQRELGDLLTFVDDFVSRNNEQFSTREEAMDMLVRAQVTGNYLPVARLIESTYGKGAFRKLSAF